MEVSKKKSIRTRFAPSPTGWLHIGGARTALFNYLFAKHEGGEFILRIEDTDKERSKPEFEKDIQEQLQWLGIKHDSQVYYQSKRTQIYRQYLQRLFDNGKAYYCFCTAEELEAQRQDMESRGVPPRYSGKCRFLDLKTVQQRLLAGEPAVIRFVMPQHKIKFNDLIRGHVEFDGVLIGDIIVAKNLDEPLFNFATPIDDSEMGITHVIRGEDHLSNTPKQIAILEALELSVPHYAHIPLILDPQRAKLSKRYGATAVREFKQQGYLPEALINFLALLGWNPGNDRELFSLEELTKEFTLEKVQKPGAVFNIEKLQWFNSQYIRQKDKKELALLCVPYWQEAGVLETREGSLRNHKKGTFKNILTGDVITFEWLEKIAGLFQERLKMLSEIVELSRFLFVGLPEYDKDLLRWKETSWEVITDNLQWVRSVLEKISGEKFNTEAIKNVIMPGLKPGSESLAGPKGQKVNTAELLLPGKERGVGETLWPLRVALSGLKASPGPFEIMEVLGKEAVLKRISHALSKLSVEASP